MANHKKNFVPNFPLMTTTDSQNFKEIQEIDVHHVVTLEVDFPTQNNAGLRLYTKYELLSVESFDYTNLTD